MNFKKNIYAISIVAASVTVLSIAGCGITPQDEGLGASSSKPVSGIVVDGYLAGATVYADVNENNKLDAWEARALTDMEGYFSYNPGKSLNYCELPASDSLSIHCLKAPAGYDQVIVRMTQGYDLATAEPFNGTISMRMNIVDADVMTPVAATPVSGLLADVPADQIAAFLLKEGLTSDLAGTDNISGLDFLDFSNALTESDRRLLLKLALQAHKVADVVENFLSPLYGTVNGGTASFFGENADAPTDGFPYVYKAMVSEALRTNATLSDVLSNSSSMQLVISVAVDNINTDVIDEFNNRLPQDPVTGLPENTADMLLPISITDVVAGTDTIVATVASTINTVFSSALFTTGTGATLDTEKEDVTSRLRAIDAVVAMTRADDAAATTAAIALVLDATYMLNLRSPKVNMVSMKEKLLAGDTTAAVADFNARQSFTELLAAGGSPFTASDSSTSVNEQGLAGNTLNLNKDPSSEESVSIDFVGTPDENGEVDLAATSGTMTIDANSLGGDYATADGTPLQLDGTWTKVDDYTMIMNIEVTAGVFEPVIVKPNDDGTGYYFDLGGEQVVWQ